MGRRLLTDAAFAVAVLIAVVFAGMLMGDVDDGPEVDTREISPEGRGAWSPDNAAEGKPASAGEPPGARPGEGAQAPGLHALLPCGCPDEGRAASHGAVSVPVPTGASGQARTPAPSGEIILLVDADALTLTVLADGKPYKTYPVACGGTRTPSPIGQWKIVDKGLWGEGFAGRWMGFDVPYGRYGIHGTPDLWSVGTYNSAGCVRMHPRDVREIYDWVKLGTVVKIIGSPFGGDGVSRTTLRPGARNSGVMEVQRRLRKLRYYDGPIDGIYGPYTVECVKRFQKAKGLKADGFIGAATYDALGMYLFE